MCSSSLDFSLPQFHLSGRQHFSFSYPRNTIFILFFRRICRSSSFSVIHVNVREELALFLFFFVCMDNQIFFTPVAPRALKLR